MPHRTGERAGPQLDLSRATPQRAQLLAGLGREVLLGLQAAGLSLVAAVLVALVTQLRVPVALVAVAGSLAAVAAAGLDP